MRERKLEFGTRPPSATQQVRPEGRVHEMKWPEKIGYLRKYLFEHNPYTTPELFSHFAAQGPLRRALSEVTRLAAERSTVTARLGLVGDLMWVRNQWESFVDAEVAKLLGGLEGLVGNLETVISPAFPVREFWPDLINFNSPPALLRSFSRAGKNFFAALSFANNHSLDFGDRGALDTLRFLESEGIPAAGLRRDDTERRWVAFERNGIRFGLYAATYGVNDRRRQETSRLLLEVIPNLSPPRPHAPPDLAAAAGALAEMAGAGIEIKLVYLHWGHEFDFYPAAYQREVAASLVRLGADIVAGAHSHVLQPDEYFFVNGAGAGDAEIPPAARLTASGPARRALVLYGLGNFATTMYTANCRLGRVAELEFYRDEGGVRWRPPVNHYLFNEPPAGQCPRRLRHARESDAPLAAIRRHLGEE